MKCPKCGKWTYVKICPRCGETLIPDEPAAKTPAVYTYDASSSPPRPAYTRAKPTAASTSPSAPVDQAEVHNGEDGVLCVSEDLFNAAMDGHEQELANALLPSSKKEADLAPQDCVESQRFVRSYKDPFITFHITAGHEAISVSKILSAASIRRNADGLLYFDKLPGFFLVESYDWAGPQYQEVTTGKTQTTHGGKDKTKRKGGLLGAAVGGVLTMNPVGAVIGYAATSRKETVHGGKDTTANTSATTTREIDAPAKLTLRNIDTGAQILLGFPCNTKLDMKLSAFFAPCPQQPPAPELTEPAPTPALEHTAVPGTVQQLKDLKELLDMGILTQEEFNAKKKELLGL